MYIIYIYIIYMYYIYYIIYIYIILYIYYIYYIYIMIYIMNYNDISLNWPLNFKSWPNTNAGKSSVMFMDVLPLRLLYVDTPSDLMHSEQLSSWTGKAWRHHCSSDDLRYGPQMFTVSTTLVLDLCWCACCWCELLFAVDHVELISDYLKHWLGMGSNSGLIITPGSGHHLPGLRCCGALWSVRLKRLKRLKLPAWSTCLSEGTRRDIPYLAAFRVHRVRMAISWAVATCLSSVVLKHKFPIAVGGTAREPKRCSMAGDLHEVGSLYDMIVRHLETCWHATDFHIFHWRGVVTSSPSIPLVHPSSKGWVLQLFAERSPHKFGSLFER